MNKIKGFTLIELLVAVSIIVLLVAILMPALRAAKAEVMDSFCFSNLYQLSKAWFAYSADYDGKLVGGEGRGHRDAPEQWVQYPQKEDGSYVSSDSDVGAAPLEDKLRGIERGALFPYIKSIYIYHCPADRRYKKPPTDMVVKGQSGGFRSYSIAGGMNGELLYSTPFESVKIHSEIKNPDDKYVFVEDCDQKGWNTGSWILPLPAGKQETWPSRWHDPIAVWHGDKSALGFADGHSEMHKWQDRRTIELAEALLWEDNKELRNQAGNVDLVYMQVRYTIKFGKDQR